MAKEAKALKKPRKDPHRKSDSCFADVVSMGVADLIDLGNEMREWFDNCSENLQQSDKMQTVEQTAETLENFDEPDLEDWLGKVRFEHLEHNYTSRQFATRSRATRRDDAVWHLQQVIDHLDKIVDDGFAFITDDKGVGMQTELTSEQLEEIEPLRDELQVIVDEAENAEFPGMYG